MNLMHYAHARASPKPPKCSVIGRARGHILPRPVALAILGGEVAALRTSPPAGSALRGYLGPSQSCTQVQTLAMQKDEYRIRQGRAPTVYQS